MKQLEVVNLFHHVNSACRLRIQNLETDDAIFYLGPYSCMLSSGKWTIEKEWSSYSSEHGEDGGTDPVEGDPGHQSLAGALAAMSKLHFEDELGKFLDRVEEIEHIEYELVEHVMGN